MMEARPQVIGLSTPGDCIPWLAHGSEREEGTYILCGGGRIARVSRRRGLRAKSKNKMKKKKSDVGRTSNDKGEKIGKNKGFL